MDFDTAVPQVDTSVIPFVSRLRLSLDLDLTQTLLPPFSNFLASIVLRPTESRKGQVHVLCSYPALLLTFNAN
jgi:hypothetical protein